MRNTLVLSRSQYLLRFLEMPLGRSLLALSLAVEQILEQPKVLLLQAKILSQQPFDHAGKFARI